MADADATLPASSAAASIAVLVVLIFMIFLLVVNIHKYEYMNVKYHTDQ